MIVQALILKKLEDLVGVSLGHCFDLVGGSGTGGLVAILLFAQSERTSTAANLTQFARDLLRYRRSEQGYREVLRSSLPNCDILSCSRTTKLFVTTSVKTVNSTQHTVLFCSYTNPKQPQPQPERIHFPTLYQTAVAGTATPGIFSPLKLGENKYSDAIFLNNNPCLLAMEEARLLFPNHPMQGALLISIGTIDDGLWSFDRRISLNDTQAFNETEIYITTATNRVRIAPKIGKSFPFSFSDESVLNDLVSNTLQWITTQESFLMTIALKLVVSSLYLDFPSKKALENTIVLPPSIPVLALIRSRFVLPEHWLVRFLGENKFVIRLLDHAKNDLLVERDQSPYDQRNPTVLQRYTLIFLVPREYSITVETDSPRLAISSFPRKFNISSNLND